MANTVGRYVPGESFFHRIDPRIKLSINIIFIVMVFIIDDFIMLGGLLALAILGFLFSGLKIKQLAKMIIPVVVIGIFLFIANSFLLKEGYGTGADGLVAKDLKEAGVIRTNGFYFDTIEWSFLTISDRSVLQTAFIAGRIYIMIIATTILTATTKPMALTKAIEDLLLPLKLLFVPVHIIAMIISIALRFVPTLLEEAQRIMKAQASRGVDFQNGNLRSKGKSMVTLIIPLFVSAFAKAEDLGNAMETRGYDPYEKRTRYRIYRIKWFDILLSLFIIGVVVVIALMINDVIEMPTWWV